MSVGEAEARGSPHPAAHPAMLPCVSETTSRTETTLGSTHEGLLLTSDLLASSLDRNATAEYVRHHSNPSSAIEEALRGNPLGEGEATFAESLESTSMRRFSSPSLSLSATPQETVFSTVSGVVCRSLATQVRHLNRCDDWVGIEYLPTNGRSVLKDAATSLALPHMPTPAPSFRSSSNGSMWRENRSPMRGFPLADSGVDGQLLPMVASFPVFDSPQESPRMESPREEQTRARSAVKFGPLQIDKE